MLENSKKSVLNLLPEEPILLNFDIFSTIYIFSKIVLLAYLSRQSIVLLVDIINVLVFSNSNSKSVFMMIFV